MSAEHDQTWRELDSVLNVPTVVVTTFRRSGVGVPTGIWATKIDGRYLFTTPSSTGKVKRLAHTERVTVEPGDKRGRATGGPVIDAIARPVDGADLLPKFRAAVRASSPIMSRVIELRYRVKRDDRLVYELTRR